MKMNMGQIHQSHGSQYIEKILSIYHKKKFHTLHCRCKKRYTIKVKEFQNMGTINATNK